MAVEQTLSIIKPDGVQKNLIGEIYGRFEKAGLEIVAARMMHLSLKAARREFARPPDHAIEDRLMAVVSH